MVSFCKSCQENGVNTRIEWQPNPDKPGKNKPFDIDKNEWHICPYWKPMKNFRQAAQKVEQEAIGVKKSPSTNQGIIEEQVNQGSRLDNHEQRLRALEIWKQDMNVVIAKFSNKSAKELMKEEQDEETVVE